MTPSPNVSASALLVALLEGRLPERRDIPPPPAELAQLLLGRPPVADNVRMMTIRTASPDTLEQACRSALGPWLVASLVGQVDPQRLWTLTGLLPSPPLELPMVLDGLCATRAASPAATQVQTLHRLELGLSELGDHAPLHLIERLGLPHTLGRIVDLLVLARESGGPSPPGASAALPLLHALDVLAVPDVFALLPASPGQHASSAGAIPVERLVDAAHGLYLLGAHATVVRLLVLAIVLTPAGQVPVEQTRLLRHLLVQGAASVPPPHVIDVWKLSFR